MEIYIKESEMPKNCKKCGIRFDCCAHIYTEDVRLDYPLKSLEEHDKELLEKFAQRITDRQALDVTDDKGVVCDKAYIVPQSFIDEIIKELQK